MKITQKHISSFIFALLLMFCVAFAAPARTFAATTKTSTLTICKGLTKSVKLTKLASGSKVKWKNSNKSVLKPVSTSSTSTTATYKLKTLKLSSGTTLTAEVYDKKGKLTKKYVYKIKVVDHNYKITKKATCKATGKKTCTLCGKEVTIAKTSHTYAWVLDEKGITTDNKKLVPDTFESNILVSEYHPQEQYYFYDQRICSGTGFASGTSSNVLSLFTMPQKTVKAGGKLTATINVQLISYHDTNDAYAGGGTNSYILTLDKKVPWEEDLNADWSAQWTATRKGGSEHEHGIIFLSGAFPHSKQAKETYAYEMPKGTKAGQIKYVLMQSFDNYGAAHGIRHWLPYRWTATCHS